jgi:uncharacterized protein YgbK (DUF1537 family)
MTLVGFYGDDVTGSVDALLQYRRAGLRGVLVTSTHAVRAVGRDHDILGIAGTARSLPTAELDDEIRPAFEALAAADPAVIQYKACSTADSSPEVGSLGRVIEVGRERFGPAPVPVVFAQPDFGRYTVFSTHFARDGNVVYRLDRHPTMSQHPSTPSDEADLRRHLARQTSLPIGAVQWPSYERGLGAALNDAEEAAIVCDALTDEHLELLGAAILGAPRRPRFVLGSGGLSLGLGRALSVGHGAPRIPTTIGAASGATLVLSGSVSPLTRRQTEAAVAAGWSAVDLFESDALERTAALHAGGASVIVSSLLSGSRTVAPGEVATRLAEIGDACLRGDPRTRFVVAGGDTSGLVLRRLGIEQIEIVATPWREVPMCRARGSAPHPIDIELVLKGGQTGHGTLFDDVRSGRTLENPDRKESPR